MKALINYSVHRSLVLLQNPVTSVPEEDTDPKGSKQVKLLFDTKKLVFVLLKNCNISNVTWAKCPWGLKFVALPVYMVSCRPCSRFRLTFMSHQLQAGWIKPCRCIYDRHKQQWGKQQLHNAGNGTGFSPDVHSWFKPNSNTVTSCQVQETLHSSRSLTFISFKNSPQKRKML